MSVSSEIKEIESHDLRRIYHVLYFLKKAEIAETVNKYVPDGDYMIYVEGKGFVCFTVGQLFEIMVINRLYGLKTPIYHIGEWSETTAIPKIYGIPSELLNDDRIGRFLDKIYPHLSTIDSKITMNIITKFKINFEQIHFDASSFQVYGEYLPVAGESNDLEITYGRSGKGRIDEKQVRFGITIAGDSKMPLVTQVHSGNTSDEEMHPEYLTELRRTLKTSTFLFIADSKFDSEENIADILRHKGTFLCPGTFTKSLKEEYISNYSQNNEFKRLKYVTGTDKKKPKNKRNYYEAFEISKKLKVETPGGSRTYRYRLIFVYSSAKAKLQAKTRNKRIRKIQSELRSLSGRLNKRNCKTYQEITKRLGRILSRPGSELFDVELRQDNGGDFVVTYGLNTREVEKAEKLEGVYTLKTNLKKKDYSLDDIMALYKRQNDVEIKIGDIKGPLQVAPIFLKKPERIASLFMIIVQALKIYTLIEREVHQAVEEKKEEIPILPEDRKSKKPKGETILRVFDTPITLTTVHFQDGSSKTYLSPLNDKQKMLYQFIERKPLDQRNFSRKVGASKIWKRAGGFTS